MSTDERIIEVNNTELSEDVPKGAKCYQKDTFKCPFIEIRTEKISPCMENSGATQAIYVQCTKFDNWDIRVSIHDPKTAWNKLNYCKSGFTPENKRDDEKEIAENEKLYKLKNPNEPFHEMFARNLFNDCPVNFKRFGKYSGIEGWAKEAMKK